MTRIIVLSSNKGGVSRTTSSINFSAGLARGVAGKPQRVLVVDTDPQANLTAVFLGPAAALGPVEDDTIYEVLVNQARIQDAIRTVELEPNDKAEFNGGTIDLLPSHIRLARAEIELQSALQRESRLTVALAAVKDNYDYIVIDTSPSLGLLTINGLVAATELIIPVEPGYFPLIGIGLLMETVNSISRMNGLQLLGVLPTMQTRTVEARETVDALRQKFGDKIFEPIPRRVSARNAHSANVDIFGYVTSNDEAVASAYKALVASVTNG